MRINGAYYLKEALVSFQRNVVLNFAAIITVGLCMVVIGTIMLGGSMAGEIKNKVEQQVEIEVYLSDTAPTRQVDAFGDLLLTWPEVRTVKYVSKAEALKKFKHDFRDQPDVIENLQGNPLPSSYRIWLKNPRKVTSVAKKIRSHRGIRSLVTNPDEDIKYGQGTVQKLFAFTGLLSMVGMAFAVMLVFVSLVLITNTIRLAVFARRKEIGIMKLVGASSWFVRWPFLLEGMIQGLMGSLMAAGVLVVLYRFLVGLVRSNKLLGFVPIDLDAFTFVRMAAVLVLAGMLIGAGGSAIALRRFLKV